MNYQIEHLNSVELSAFLRLQAQDAFPGLKDEARLTMLAEKWASNADCCTCRDENDMLIGMVAFYANRPENEVVYLIHVYVRSEYRGKKVFSSMLQLIVKYAKEKSFSTLRLEVKRNNETAQIVYAHNGFNITGIASDDTIYMQRQL